MQPPLQATSGTGACSAARAAVVAASTRDLRVCCEHAGHASRRRPPVSLRTTGVSSHDSFALRRRSLGRFGSLLW
eukprot:735129-Prorocentrum_minimum.AAC.1